MSKLCLHSGGILVDRAVVGAVQTPPRTNTWVPVPHLDFVEQTVDQLSHAGVAIKAEQHALSKGGDRYFGLFDLDLPTDLGYELVVGLRNSHDRSFVASVAMGTSVFCCDNLSFDAQVKLTRKHTAHIVRDLPRLMNRVVSRIVDSRFSIAARVERYQASALDDRDTNDLIVRAIDLGIVGPQKLRDVLVEWRKPSHEEFAPRNAWSLYNSFTEAFKGYEPSTLVRRSQLLHGLFDSACCLQTSA